jgi:hypothetical protein
MGVVLVDWKSCRGGSDCKVNDFYTACQRSTVTAETVRAFWLCYARMQAAHRLRQQVFNICLSLPVSPVLESRRELAAWATARTTGAGLMSCGLWTLSAVS